MPPSTVPTRPTVILCVDLGNSSAKFCAFDVDSAPELRTARVGFWASRQNRDTADADRTFLRELRESLRASALPAVEHIALSSVLDPSATEQWTRALRDVFEASLHDALDCGLTNDTLFPERVGRDRLFAARGALECTRESTIVIDVGTAAKVDVVKVERDGARAAFLGGAIAPGPALLAKSLSTGAARLFEVEPRPDPAALGRDSRAAMESGIAIGLRGAVRELEREIAREAGLVDPPIALCGGARGFVASAFRGRRVIEEPHLVPIGLCAAWLDAGDAMRRTQWIRG